MSLSKEDRDEIIKAKNNMINKLDFLVGIFFTGTCGERNLHGTYIFSGEYADNVIISGSFFPSIWHSENPGDVDVFIYGGKPKENHAANLIKWYYDSDICSGISGKTKYLKKTNGRINGSFYKNGRILDIYNAYHEDHQDLSFQFIITDYATPKELVADFDFKHVTPYYNVQNKKLTVTEAAINSIKNKKLVWNKDPQLISNYYRNKRVEKYTQRGWEKPDPWHSFWLAETRSIKIEKEG